MSRQKRKRKRTSKCEPNKVSKNENKKETQKKSTKKISIERARYPNRRYEEFHDHFLNYEQILTFLSKIRTGNPKSVNLEIIGYSGQGKPIYMVLITNIKPANHPRHAAFIEAGLHGEDTIAVSNALFIINHLTKNPNHLNIMDYFIVPCGNPDAYDKFVKSKVKNEEPHCIKRAESSTALEAKKPRLHHHPQNIPESQREPRQCYNFYEALKVCNDHFNDCLYKDFFTYLAAKRERKRKKITCVPYFKRNNKNTKNSKKSSENVNNIKNNNKSNAKEKQKDEISVPMDLCFNFPVILGLNSMKEIPTNTFLEQIKLWKEKYVSPSPETSALMRTINKYQFAIKLLISLQEGGEAICYPYGFCKDVTQESNDLIKVAKKGKCAISGRCFQTGSVYDIRGLTYGSLIDFIKIDRGSIKYTFMIQVYKKTANYNEKRELQNLMTYGCDIMKCIKSMSTAVYKFYTDINSNKKIEIVRFKQGIDKMYKF